jgi:hypothetical protein
VTIKEETMKVGKLLYVSKRDIEEIDFKYFNLNTL